MMAAKYTCAAAGFEGSLSPELSWTAGPAGTKSYAITFIDVFLTEKQPPDELGYHWVIYDIPASTLSLPEEFKDAASIGASQNRAYLGPCPNFGGGTAEHSYEFKLYALASETLTLSPTTGIQAVKDAETKLEASHLASATLSAKSSAAPP
jgi:Raf kinase inhibitor-like YbhB/YbcL family protein